MVAIVVISAEESKKKSKECLRGYVEISSPYKGCKNCNESGSEEDKAACNKAEDAGFITKKSPKCFLGYKASAPDKTDCKFCTNDLQCCFDEADNHIRCGPNRIKKSPDCASRYSRDLDKQLYYCKRASEDPREIGGANKYCKKSPNCILGFAGGSNGKPCKKCGTASCCVEEGYPKFCQCINAGRSCN